MELKNLYLAIDLQPEIIQKLEAVRKEMTWELYEPFLEQMTERKTAAAAFQGLGGKLQTDEGHFRMLACQLECARRNASKYAAKGISQEIFVDTMKCFSRFLKECLEKNGVMFFDRGWWTYRQVSMSLFRIGALEYELCEENGEKTIGIHIPSDADLSSSSVDLSLEKAQIFFDTFYPDFCRVKYTCHSWLLSPVLKTLLPEASNILSFQKRFQILQDDWETREFMEWVFQMPEDVDYGILPERTTLQKNAKKLLLNGGTIGASFGVISDTAGNDMAGKN